MSYNPIKIAQDEQTKESDGKSPYEEIKFLSQKNNSFKLNRISLNSKNIKKEFSIN